MPPVDPPNLKLSLILITYDKIKPLNACLHDFTILYY